MGCYQNWLDSGRGNVIISLPMKDKETAHINETGINHFSQNGLIETADRGANQDNCVASEFADASCLSNVSASSLSDNKTFTIAFNFTPDDTTQNVVAYFKAGSDEVLLFDFSLLGDIYGIRFRLFNSGGTAILDIDSHTNYSFVSGRQYSISFSVDLSSALNRHFYVNGVDIESDLDINTYTNEVIDFSNIDLQLIGGLSTTSYLIDGSLGETYIDNSYIDLATSNPFYDSDTNKPVPVRTAMANLGSNPLICMPIDASNPIANYGSGGDFTLNGGGILGSRGASEFLSRSAYGDGTSGYLKSSSVAGLSASKTFSFVCVGKLDATGSDTLISLQHTGDSANNFRILWSSDNVNILGNNSSEELILNIAANAPPAGTSTNWFTMMVCVDLANSLAKVYVNGVDEDTGTPTLTNDFLNLNTTDTNYIMAEAHIDVVRQWWDGAMGFAYFTTDYIDFSQEANRNLFISQLGYPRNIKPEIEAGNIPTPLILLEFDDTANLGKNEYGTDFTVNGTVTAGADFAI